MSNEYLQIKDLVARTGLDREALRFYEKEGLLPKATRTQSGYRRFPPETVARIEFIKLAKEGGFTLNEIREILNLGSKKSLTKKELNAIAEDKIKRIDERITSLNKMRELLSAFVACQGRQPTPPMKLILNEFKQLRIK